MNQPSSLTPLSLITIISVPSLVVSVSLLCSLKASPPTPTTAILFHFLTGSDPVSTKPFSEPLGSTAWISYVTLRLCKLYPLCVSLTDIRNRRHTVWDTQERSHISPSSIKYSVKRRFINWFFAFLLCSAVLVSVQLLIASFWQAAGSFRSRPHATCAGECGGLLSSERGQNFMQQIMWRLQRERVGE